MKVVVFNGWKDFPHLRWRFLMLPFGWNLTRHKGRGQFDVSLFGFAFVFYW